MSAIQAEIIAPRSIELELMADEPLEDGRIRVVVELSGLCGSDLHFYEVGAPTPGTPFGHEILGRVVGTGGNPQFARFQGRRVVVSPYIFCGTCEFCAADSPANCVDRAPSFASGFASYADVALAPDMSNVLIVPDRLPSRAAVLAEPTSVALRAVKQAQRVTRSADRAAPVVVLGAGPIGLLVVAVLRHRGFEQIWVLDRSEGRRDLAVDIGAHRVFPGIDELGEALGALPDKDTAIAGTGPLPPVRMIFECSGAGPLLAHAAHEWLGRGGVITQVGLFGRPVEVNIDSLLRKEAALVTSYAYSPADWPDALALLGDDAERIMRIVKVYEDLSQLPDVVAGVQEGTIVHKPVIAC